MSADQLTAGAERPAVEAGPGEADRDQAGSGAATVSRLDEIRASLANKDGSKSAGGKSKSTGDAAAAT
jgi:hypothetical protein